MNDVILSGGPRGGYVILEWPEGQEIYTLRGSQYRLLEDGTAIYIGEAE